MVSQQRTLMAAGSAGAAGAAAGGAKMTELDHLFGGGASSVATRSLVMASADEDSRLRKRAAGVLRGHSGAVYSAAISVDGRLVASASEDGSVRVWTSITNSVVLALKGHGHPVWDVSWSFEGVYLASASYDSTARLWSMNMHYPLRIFVGHQGDVDCVKFHPNCNYIATGGADRTIRLWDLSVGNQVRVLRGHRTSVTALAFFPENDMLISGAENGEVLLWDLKMGRLLARNAVAHSDAVTGLDVCLPAVGGGGGGGGGTLFASASLDCTVKVWDSSSVADPSESVVSPVTGDTPGNEFRPVKEFRTRDTPLQTLRFGLTNVIYTAGAPRVDD